VGTLISSFSIWCFLIVLTLSPLAYVYFKNELDLADTPANAHKVIMHVKKVNKCLKLIALCVFALEVQSIVLQGLQAACEVKKIHEYKTNEYNWEYPGSCIWSFIKVGARNQLDGLMAESTITKEEVKASIATTVSFVIGLIGPFLVTYIVT
jgi:hypothetical protein